MRTILFCLIGLCGLVAVAMADEGAERSPQQPTPPIAERCGGGGG